MGTQGLGADRAEGAYGFMVDIEAFPVGAEATWAFSRPTTFPSLDLALVKGPVLVSCFLLSGASSGPSHSSTGPSLAGVGGHNPGDAGQQ